MSEVVTYATYRNDSTYVRRVQSNEKSSTRMRFLYGIENKRGQMVPKVPNHLLISMVENQLLVKIISILMR